MRILPEIACLGIGISIFGLILLAFIFGDRKKSSPALIDLEEYAADLLRSKDISSNHLMPPPCIPGRVGKEWTCEEMQAMNANRRVAQAIYKAVKENDL